MNSDSSLASTGKAIAAGSLFLGLGLGLIAGGLTYLFQRRLHKKLRPTDAVGATDAVGTAGAGAAGAIIAKPRGGLGLPFMIFMIKFFGRRSAYFFLYFIVPYFYLLAPKARRAANEYWKVTQPNLSWISRQGRVLKQIFRFAELLIDRFYYQSRGSRNLPMTIDTSEYVPPPEGKGIFFVNSHVGGWSMSSYAFAKLNPTKKPLVVMYVSPGFRYENALYLSETENPLAVIQQNLLAGQPVCIMTDRPIGRSYELVPFFGKLALFDTTSFRLHRLLKVPVAAAFCFKASDKYKVTIKNILPTNQSGAEPTFFMLHCYAVELEAQLKKYPEQWFNFFPFWSQPPQV